MNDIKIIKDNENFKKIEKSDLYINIFGEEPWNEWYKCNDCSKLFGLSDATRNNIKKCLCGGNLDNLYDKNQVSKDWIARTKKKWYIWKLAQTLDDKIIWFWLWRMDDITNLNAENLWLDNDDLLSLKSWIKNLYPDFDFDSFFYAAEAGIKNEFRSKWIASKIYKSFLEKIKENNSNYILLRTTTKDGWPFKWLEKLWYRIVFKYNDENDRIIMVNKY